MVFSNVSGSVCGRGLHIGALSPHLGPQGGKLARAGKLPNLTGIGSPYEPPEQPEISLNAGSEKPEALAEHIFGFLKDKGFV